MRAIVIYFLLLRICPNISQERDGTGKKQTFPPLLFQLLVSRLNLLGMKMNKQVELGTPAALIVLSASDSLKVEDAKQLSGLC